MKVYVLLRVETVGDHWINEKVEVLEAIFATREAAESKVKESFKKTRTIIEEWEVKQ